MQIGDYLRTGIGLVRAGIFMQRLKPSASLRVPDVFEDRVAAHPDRTCVLFEDRELSYAELNAEANRVAHWAHRSGLGRGDVVALLMTNRPEYLITWLGLSKVGVISALINTNLTGRALQHALDTADPKHLIVGPELLSSLASLERSPLKDGRIWVLAESEPLDGAQELPEGGEDFWPILKRYSGANPDRALRADVRTGDEIFYIYTSGTTGNPKAARFSHLRFLNTAGMGMVGGIGPDDVIYCALPLYHTAGGVVVIGTAWTTGAAIALRRRFSARYFWDDIRRYRVTVFQYIGEFCRYLLNQPPRDDDRDHRVRLAIGNGLRPDIWEEFETRFGIPRILEFYGATEGNVALVNFFNKRGSVGKMPPRFFSNMRLVAYDIENDTHVRNERGFLVECKPGEVGELIGSIPEGKDSSRGRFEGYTSGEATEKKILRDAFQPGDAWFRSGDLLRCDRQGYFYFVDRIGDTYRWKGENVSTQEVAEHLQAFPGVEMANVYGVQVEGADGRAGMAALALKPGQNFDGQALYGFVETGLAAYAAPVFVRLQGEAEVTGTFKLRKVDLQRDGFDPGRVGDPLFVRDDEAKAYVPLDAERFAGIQSGRHRL